MTASDPDNRLVERHGFRTFEDQEGIIRDRDLLLLIFFITPGVSWMSSIVLSACLARSLGTLYITIPAGLQSPKIVLESAKKGKNIFLCPPEPCPAVSHKRSNPVDRRGAARGTDGERSEGAATGPNLIATRFFAALRLRVTHKGDIPCKPYGVPTSSTASISFQPVFNTL